MGEDPISILMHKQKYKYKAVVADYTFPDLEIEKRELEKVNAELIGAHCKPNDEGAIIAVSKNVHAIFSQNAIISRRVIESLRRCQVIVCYGVGLECVDVEAATEHSIIIANVPDYCINEVSDHTMALILSCLRKVTQETIAIKRNPKELIYGRPLFPPIFKLRGQVLGLVGFGNVAQNLVSKARPFGFKIIAYDPFVAEETFKKYEVRQVTLDNLLKISDVASLHLPLNEKTENLITEAELMKMKETAFLINTSRGQIIDESALYKALKQGWIAGAGIDVTVEEPINPDNPLVKLDNLIITNHIGYYSEGCLEEVRIKAAKEVARVLSGRFPRPIAFVNPQVKQEKIND